jgi:hypothetical protein
VVSELDNIPMRLHIGAAVHGDEAAVALVEHQRLVPSEPGSSLRAWRHYVHAVLRPPPTVDTVADLLAEIARDYAVADPRFLVVPDELGAALYDTLAQERRRSRDTGYAASMLAAGRVPFLGRVHAYRKVGAAQQDILNRLSTAQRAGLLELRRGMKHAAAVDKALMAYDRTARDERYIPPIVAALAVTVWSPTTGGEPRVIGRDGVLYPHMEAARGAGSGAVYR